MSLKEDIAACSNADEVKSLWRVTVRTIKTLKADIAANAKRIEVLQTCSAGCQSDLDKYSTPDRMRASFDKRLAEVVVEQEDADLDY